MECAVQKTDYSISTQEDMERAVDETNYDITTILEEMNCGINSWTCCRSTIMVLLQ